MPPARTAGDSNAARILDAALGCIARYGVAKTTVDDIAREAGCSRATLYRSFPNKGAVVSAVASREIARLGDAIRGAVADDGTLEQAVTAVVVAAATHLGSLPALSFVLAHEPEAVMPYLVFERADAALVLAGDLGTNLFAPWLERDAARRTGQLIARIVLSHFAHTQILILTDLEHVRTLVHEFVVPGVSTITTAR